METVAFDWYGAVKPYTLTKSPAVARLASVVEAVIIQGVPGALAECGVWRGGSAMVMIYQMQQLGAARDLFLFDTFTGMPAPAAIDGETAARTYAGMNKGAGWLAAGLDEVMGNLLGTAYPLARLHPVVGDVAETLAHTDTGPLALAHLDTDWYASTRIELETLWPRLSPGGALVIDDYDCWEGARRAVDEFFDGQRPDILGERVSECPRVVWKPSHGTERGLP